METTMAQKKVLTFNVDDIYALIVERANGEEELIYVDIEGNEVAVVKEDGTEPTFEDWLSILYYGENPDNDRDEFNLYLDSDIHQFLEFNNIQEGRAS